MTATNATLREILCTEKGPSCIKSLAWMMFAGIEDGAKIIIEPLLDSDVTFNLEKNSALIAINFGVKVPQKLHQWTGKDKREFDDLEEALAEAERAMEAHGAEALQEAVSKSAREVAALNSASVRKITLNNEKQKKKKKHRTLQDRWRQRGQGRKKKKDDPFSIFVKAAKFVRGMGAGTIHPSAKLRLFGLLMQAQRGNVPEGDTLVGVSASLQSQIGSLTGSALALQKLKLRAWRSQKDKGRENAMKEYVELVTSLAPQWKVAHILGAHSSVKENKPKSMMWVLKVNYRELTEDAALAAATIKRSLSTSIHRYRVTSIEILQSSNAAGARLWTEEKMVTEKVKGEKKAGGVDSASGGLGGEGVGEEEEAEEDEEEAKEEDLFVATIPKDLSLSDCIVDKAKFKTIEKQRAFFQTRMREMSRTYRYEEDGWNFYCKTRSHALAESEQ